MAVVRARTSPPYALILFVVLWVITAGIAIFLFTQQGELKKKAAEAESKLKQRSKDSELSIASAYMNKPGSPMTAFGVVQDQRIKLAGQINGTANAKDDLASGDVAFAKGSAAITLAEGKLDPAKKPATLVDAVNNLSEKVTTLENDKKMLEENLKKAVADFNGARESAKNANEKNVQGMEQQTAAIKKLEEEKAALEAKVPEVAAAGQAQLSKLQETYEKQIRELGVQIAELKGLLAKAQLTIVNQKNEIMAGRRLITSSVSDIPSGKILRTNVAAGEVTIALGVSDHVVRGLTFQVFDQRTGIKVGKDDNEAKGAIEIVEVGEHESRCRVTHLERNKMIQQNDLIYNLVFSQQKNRKYRFAVYGDFDLDGDGNATSTEKDRIVAMIKSWGGSVDEIPVVELRDLNGQPINGPDGKVLKAPQVMPETDFLVQGAEPVDPKMSKDLDLVSAEHIEKMKNDYAQFKVIEGSARSSGVTILNTNRFLYLIGYYNTTLVRY